MNDPTVQMTPNSEDTRRRNRVGAALPILILLYLIVWISTRAHFMADTNVYTQAILRHQSGTGPIDYRSTTANPFWDFGHILWRPLGWLCFVLAKPGTDWLTHQNLRADVLLTLMGINFLAALLCVVCCFLLARRVARDEWSALFATIGFFSADAFLNYAHTGNAYVVGLACLVAGMYLALPDKTNPVSVARALAAGVMFALAVLFWLPYVFVLPAALAAPLVLDNYEKSRLRLGAYTLGACAVIGLGAYASAIAATGIRNLADLSGWILASGHGHIQPGGFRAAARLAFAVPRSFVNMDRDGMWLKRYLVHDPYAPVTIRTLLGLSLWKPLLFYASALAVGMELSGAKAGRALLMLLAATVLPIFIFAVFIFEAGSIERYLPLYPFIFLAFGYVLASKRAKRGSEILLLVTLAAMAVVNVNAMRRGTLDLRRDEAVARIHDLIPLLGPNSLILAVNEQDNLAEFRQNFPLDPINLDTTWRTYNVLEINTERLATWREDLAMRVLSTWQRGGTVWMPMRFLRAQPRPEWNWVEGDDKRVKWTDLPQFFSQFESGPVVNGEDGFLLLPDSPKNRGILEALDPVTPSQ
jgi:hypothetical protein